MGPVPEAAGARGARRVARRRAGSTCGRSRATTRASCSCFGSNPLRRIRSYPLRAEAPVAEAAHVVTLDWRMTSTATALRLRAAGRRLVRAHRAQVGDAAHAVHPRRREGRRASTRRSRDWEICRAARQARSTSAPRARGITDFTDRHGRERPLRRALRRRSRRTASSVRPTTRRSRRRCSSNASNLDGVELGRAQEEGLRALHGRRATASCSIGNATRHPPDDTITPLTDHVIDKKPYPTLSRRIQFYLDQELYLEMGETAARSTRTRRRPAATTRCTLTGGHTRWSIHSAWRDDTLMLRQQRGEPVMYMSVDGCGGARDRTTATRVRVFNDLDAFEIMAKVSPAVRPGQLIIYHAWENFQFKGRQGLPEPDPDAAQPGRAGGRPVPLAADGRSACSRATPIATRAWRSRRYEHVIVCALGNS